MIEFLTSAEVVLVLYLLGAHGAWSQASALFKIGRLEEPDDHKWKPSALNFAACATIAVLWPLWEVWGMLDGKRRR